MDKTEIIKKAVKRAQKNGKVPRIKGLYKTDKVILKSMGNFTLATIKRGKMLYNGIAKRNPMDRNDFETGAIIALHRAVLDSCES